MVLPTSTLKESVMKERWQENWPRPSQITFKKSIWTEWSLWQRCCNAAEWVAERLTGQCALSHRGSVHLNVNSMGPRMRAASRWKAVPGTTLRNPCFFRTVRQHSQVFDWQLIPTSLSLRMPWLVLEASVIDWLIMWGLVLWRRDVWLKFKGPLGHSTLSKLQRRTDLQSSRSVKRTWHPLVEFSCTFLDIKYKHALKRYSGRNTEPTTSKGIS